MSITSFSKPSNADILLNIDAEDERITFIDKGLVLQNVNETRYVRKVKITSENEEIFKNVVYIKLGIHWCFKKIETIEVHSNH